MLVNLQTNNKAAAHNQCSNVIDVIDEKPNNVLIKAFRQQIKLFTVEFLVNPHFCHRHLILTLTSILCIDVR